MDQNASSRAAGALLDIGDRQRRQAQHGVGDRSGDDFLDERFALVAHDDQIAALVPGAGHDALGDRPQQHLRLVRDSRRVQQLARRRQGIATAGFPHRLDFARLHETPDFDGVDGRLYVDQDDPSRLVPDRAGHAALDERILERIAECWAIMESQITPGRYLLGDELSVLDLYVAVVSRFSPRRQRFYEVAPKMGEVVRRIDEDPRLAALWADRMG